MNATDFEYTFIDTPEQLSAFYKQHKSADWIAIDTEFIGENRYRTLLCLIQIASPEGLFLIDGITLEGKLQDLMQLIQEEKILKITHAGENDYRLFKELYSILPSNIFDTQVAAGFLTGQYPLSFQKLIAHYLNLKIPKGFSTTNWDNRPLSKKQITYAIQDVVYLKQVFDKQKKQLQDEGKWEWALEEMILFQDASFYLDGPEYAFLKDKLAQRLNLKSQVFLLRLYQWRDELAEKNNQSLRRILADNHMHLLAQHIHNGKQALLANRRLPDRFLRKNWDDFTELHNRSITDEERETISKLPTPVYRSAESELAMDLLFWIIKHRCLETNVAHGLVLRGSSLSKLKTQKLPDNHPAGKKKLSEGWRRELIGDSLNAWLDDDVKLSVKPQGKGYYIEMKS